MSCESDLYEEIMYDINYFEAQLPINMRRVRKHDHLTNKHQGAAHSYCNLNVKIQHFEYYIGS